MIINPETANELTLLASSILAAKRNLDAAKAEIKEMEDRVHELLPEGEKFEAENGLSISVTREIVHTSLDTKKVKMIHPEIYAECCKTSVVKSSVKVAEKK